MGRSSNSKRIVSVILALLFIPLTSLLDELLYSHSATSRDYALALSLFNEGASEYEQAKALFKKTKNYADSAAYYYYIEGLEYAAKEEWYDASCVFFTLSGMEFLDTVRLYDYAQARRALEENGDAHSAMILLDRVGDFKDAPTLLVNLKTANPDIDITKEPLPKNAKIGGFAYVIPEMEAPMKKMQYDNDNALHDRMLKQWDVVRVIKFEWDKQGEAWALAALPTLDPDADRSAPVGYLYARRLQYMDEANEINYIAALKAAPPATDHYARLTTNSVNLRPEPKKANTVGTLGKKDIVETFEIVSGDDGEDWTRVKTVQGKEGYIPTKYLQPLNGSEADTHRAAIGASPVVYPHVTPMPTQYKEIAAQKRITLPEPFPIPEDPSERYDTALWLLSVGYAQYEQVPALQKATELFASLKNDAYMDDAQIDQYIQFAELMTFVERAEYSAARYRLWEIQKSDNEKGYRLFDYRNKPWNATEFPIPPAYSLSLYMKARQASDEGDIEWAIVLLEGVHEGERPLLDSVDRMISLAQSLPEGPSIYNAAMGYRSKEMYKYNGVDAYIPDYLDERMRALYDAMESGEVESARTILDRGYDSINGVDVEWEEDLVHFLRESFHWSMWLFDGDEYSPLHNGRGLVLRDYNKAFFGDFKNGLPDGECFAVISNGKDAEPSVNHGAWKEGVLVGGDNSVPWENAYMLDSYWKYGDYD
ncbi:MAG: hypothetical protein LBK46_09885 [Oscillospiraceae bacterium]|jgi:hypothetical protein|nr:hypothetical protein [Oscillospiraceae bacterium]